MAAKTKNTKLADGLYLAVDAKGKVVCAYVGGPRLYVSPRVARKSADFGGRVFRLWEDSTGVHITQEFV